MSGRTQGTFLGQQAGHQPWRGQERPQLIDRGPDRRLIPQPGAGVGDVLGVELAAQCVRLGRRERGKHVGGEQLARHIVRLAQRAGPVAGPQDAVPRHRHPDAVGADLQVARWHLLAIPHRPAQHVDHLEVALDHRGFGVVVGGGPDTREQLGDRAEHHVGLAQRRQDLADVAQEGGVRPDDQDAAAFQGPAVGVEQVRGPVQRRDRLAGARAALDDQDALQARAYHPVLLGLDGGDHVAHPAGAAGGDAGDQHGLAGQGFPVRFGQPVQVEDLVVDAGDGAVPGVNVAAPDQAVRVLRGGGVKGMRGRRAPVDKPRLELVVPQADPADVQLGRALTRGFGVGAAEAQAVLHRVQLGQPAALFARGDLALHPGLESTARAAAAVGLRERALSPLPCRIKQAVKHIDISLLLANSRLAGGIGLTKRHIYWYTFLDLELAC